MVSTDGTRRMGTDDDDAERGADLFAKMHRKFPNQPPSIKSRRSFWERRKQCRS